jgi:hypothetical protein
MDLVSSDDEEEMEGAPEQEDEWPEVRGLAAAAAAALSWGKLYAALFFPIAAPGFLHHPLTITSHNL